MSKYYLQNRWVLEKNSLYYYGLRNRENLFKNKISISKKQEIIIKKLPCLLSDEEKNILGKLLNVQVVEEKDLRMVPSSLNEATFCVSCSANDYIIPGLEFNENGQCPMCQTWEDVKSLKSVVPIVDEIPTSKKSRFDVAVFYTGGKDSTFLLYYLAKQKKLRVLALTWEIPFISDSARKSIENAKKHFDNVEFLTRTVMKEDLHKIYKKLYEISENNCACPSLAYILFYPELVSNKVPYFVVGNEPVQMLGLYYNHLAPKIAYSFGNNRFMLGLINFGRILKLHPPLKRGQFETLLTMKQLAYGDNFFKKISGYSNPLVSNVVQAIHEVPTITKPLKRSIFASSWSGNIPSFVHIDFDKISGGKYDWNKIKDILVKECGWVAPSENNKALHTSCKIEKCKDRSQFIRFYNCKSKMIPFSAIEISLAGKNCSRSREELLDEIENHLGFTFDELPECSLMCGWCEDKND